MIWGLYCRIIRSRLRYLRNSIGERNAPTSKTSSPSFFSASAIGPVDFVQTIFCSTRSLLKPLAKSNLLCSTPPEDMDSMQCKTRTFPPSICPSRRIQFEQFANVIINRKPFSVLFCYFTHGFPPVIPHGSHSVHSVKKFFFISWVNENAGLVISNHL